MIGFLSRHVEFISFSRRAWGAQTLYTHMPVDSSRNDHLISHRSHRPKDGMILLDSVRELIKARWCRNTCRISSTEIPVQHGMNHILRRQCRCLGRKTTLCDVSKQSPAFPPSFPSVLSLSHAEHVYDSVETSDRFHLETGIWRSLASWSYSCSSSVHTAIDKVDFKKWQLWRIWQEGCEESNTLSRNRTRCGEPSSTDCAGTNSWTSPLRLFEIW